MNIDTGSQVNIIDEDTFHRLAIKPELQHATTTLYGNNSTTPITTGITTPQTNNEVNLRLIVTKGSAGNLLTYPAATQPNGVGTIGSISSTNVCSTLKVQQRIDQTSRRSTH